VEQTTRIDVEASVERVWEVLREVERWPEWAPRSPRCDVWTTGRSPSGPGPGGAAPDPSNRVRVVTELEPGRSFSWVATAPGVRTTARHLLEALGTGNTRVLLAVEEAGPVGVVMGRFYRRLTDRSLTAEAEGIKARSERRDGTPAMREPAARTGNRP